VKRIMFVDDESRILDGIRRMLYAERKQWEMEFVLGGEAALKACEEKSFDVVISDMRMPGMDAPRCWDTSRPLSEYRAHYPLWILLKIRWQDARFPWPPLSGQAK